MSAAFSTRSPWRPAARGHRAEVRVLHVGAPRLVADDHHLGADHAERGVVEDHQLDRDVEAGRREQLAHQHREAAVAAEGDDLTVGGARLRADGLGHARWPSSRG